MPLFQTVALQVSSFKRNSRFDALFSRRVLERFSSFAFCGSSSGCGAAVFFRNLTLLMGGRWVQERLLDPASPKQALPHRLSQPPLLGCFVLRLCAWSFRPCLVGRKNPDNNNPSSGKNLAVRRLRLYAFVPLIVSHRACRAFWVSVGINVDPPVHYSGTNKDLKDFMFRYSTETYEYNKSILY